MSSQTDLASLKKQISVKRTALRALLMRRMDSNACIECCHCHKYSYSVEGFDLHEIIFSRQIVRSLSYDAQLAIHDHRNCGWVHRGCHQLAEGGSGRLEGIIYLIKHEGLYNIEKYVREMSLHIITIHEFMNDVHRALAIMEGRLKYLNDHR